MDSETSALLSRQLRSPARPSGVKISTQLRLRRRLLWGSPWSRTIPYSTATRGGGARSHGDLQTFLLLNGFKVEAQVDEQERLMLALAAREVECSGLLQWLREHVVPRTG